MLLVLLLLMLSFNTYHIRCDDVTLSSFCSDLALVAYTCLSLTFIPPFRLHSVFVFKSVNLATNNIRKLTGRYSIQCGRKCPKRTKRRFVAMFEARKSRQTTTMKKERMNEMRKTTSGVHFSYGNVFTLLPFRFILYYDFSEKSEVGGFCVFVNKQASQKTIVVFTELLN